MGSAKGGKKVIHRLRIGYVDRRKLQRHPWMFSMEKVIESHPNIEKIARGDARRIRIVVLSSRRGNDDPSGAPLRIGEVTGGDRIVQRREVVPAIEAHGRLLVAIKSQCRGQVWNRSCHQAAFILPRKAQPRIVVVKPLDLREPILDVRGLLKFLVVIDAESTDVQRRVENQAADLRAEKSRAGVPHSGICRETVPARHVHSHGSAVDFGFSPLNRKSNGRIEKRVKVKIIVSKFPEVPGGDHKVSAEGLLKAGVKLIPAARHERVLSESANAIRRQAARSGGAGKQQILIIGRIKQPRIACANDGVGRQDGVRNTDSGLKLTGIAQASVNALPQTAIPLSTGPA